MICEICYESKHYDNDCNNKQCPKPYCRKCANQSNLTGKCPFCRSDIKLKEKYTIIEILGTLMALTCWIMIMIDFSRLSQDDVLEILYADMFTYL